MKFHTDDNREYSPTIESWVRDFRMTMETGILTSGNDSGDTLPGIKIVFDGYGENDDSSPNYNFESFAVFIHETSLNVDEFPPHDDAFGFIIHRPKEEVCIYCWYDVGADSVTVIPFEDNNSTEMDADYVVNLIADIDSIR